MNANTRLKLGIALLILGLVMPVGTLAVAATDWPDAVKAIVSGVLVFGFEIMAIPAAALMGKENFHRIMDRAKGALAALKPAGNVGRTRYHIGLVLFVAPILVGWVFAYVPSWMPQDPTARLGANIALDLVFLVSLFVLGGDFWDKLRSLFLHDARAVFATADGNVDATTSV